MKRILFLCLLLAGQARADEWSRADTVRQVIASAVIIADWRQTLYIADHPESYYEKTNFFLDKHPDREAVNTYFALFLLSNYAVAAALPPSWRPYFQYLTIGYEAYYVRHNLSIGIGFEF